MLTFKSYSGIHELYAEQTAPISLKEAWDFFSNPQNLTKITPTAMNFVITNNPGSEIYDGQVIAYRVSPFKGVRASWVTEIKGVVSQKMFIDEQRFGPYSFWHHKHFFEEHENGVLLKDLIHYKIPFGFIGRMVEPSIVRNKLKAIFDYRHSQIATIFS